MWRPASPAIGAVDPAYGIYRPVDHILAHSMDRTLPTVHHRSWHVMPQDIEGIGLLVSRSVTKDLQLPDRIMENLGIMRLRSVWMTTI